VQTGHGVGVEGQMLVMFRTTKMVCRSMLLWSAVFEKKKKNILRVK